MTNILSVAGAVISIPFKWVWDVGHAGALRMRLQTERNQLRALRELRTVQLEMLRAGGGQILRAMIGGITPNLMRAEDESFITVQMHIFNGSMFVVNYTGVHAQVRLDGKLLPMASTIQGTNFTMGAGQIGGLVFVQPIQPQTVDLIRSHAAQGKWISWLVDIQVDYSVAGEDIRATFRQGNIDRREVPLL